MESSWINTSSLALDLSVGPRWLPDEASRRRQTGSTHAQQSVSQKDEVSYARRLITDSMLPRTYPQACL
ncbi:hypothetical protein B296_00055207 [Ensete ventricosum]|uniref:Uncharacterized protein n=1 Tax=Ensete ventricosum TaxID=4639 RepID=A0A426XMB3_ENSVE|nr:hypothetical protein B296_00055207 [Ensete ventricosum]